MKSLWEIPASSLMYIFFFTPAPSFEIRTKLRRCGDELTTGRSRTLERTAWTQGADKPVSDLEAHVDADRQDLPVSLEPHPAS